MDNRQLGFDQMLMDTEQQNEGRRIEREFGDLPTAMDEGAAFFLALIDDHHEAMMDADVPRVMTLRKRANALARRLHGSAIGCLAEGSAGSALVAATAAPTGKVPKWGQSGSFIIEVARMRVRVEIEGLLGLTSVMYWPGFSAHVVDADELFLSETGYQSFFGLQMDARPGVTPDAFAAMAIAAYVERYGRRRVDRLRR